MKTTSELIEQYLKIYYNINTKINLYNYELNGSVIKVSFNYKKDEKDITDLDRKYNTEWREESEEIDLLDYITYITQL